MLCVPGNKFKKFRSNLIPNLFEYNQKSAKNVLDVSFISAVLLTKSTFSIVKKVGLTGKDLFFEIKKLFV
jgi:hypothetical protein